MATGSAGKNKFWLLLVAMVWLGFLLATYLFEPPFFSLLNYKLYDVMLAQLKKDGDLSQISIVDIDEQSLADYGQWPWPRYRVAMLLENILQAGPKAVSLDILFAEQDRTSLQLLSKELKRDLGVDLEFSDLPASVLNSDAYLAKVLASGPFVLGFALLQDSGVQGNSLELLPKLNVVQIGQQGASPDKEKLLCVPGAVLPLPVLLQGAAGVGFMNVYPDPDGVIRKTPLLLQVQDTLVANLALSALLVGTGTSEPLLLRVTPGGISSLQIGKHVIPLDAKGRLLINYQGEEHSFGYVSAGQVLKGNYDLGLLKNKFIFIGSSAQGLKDIRVTPLDPVFPGVEIQANILQNILSDDYLRRPDFAPGLELSLLVLMAVLSFVLIYRSSARMSLPVCVGCGFLLWQGTNWIFGGFRVFISPLYPLLALAGNFSLLNLVKFWITEKEKRFLRSAFSHYVSGSVVDEIVSSPEKLSLEGQEREVSIFFSDIRGFTSISEAITPTQLTNLLRDYFTPVTRTILQYQGTLDKFIGDALMAFWNAPIEVENHQQKAVQAALANLKNVRLLNGKFQEVYGVSLKVGIGLHAGACRVGNMGSVDLFDYTIIGDNVNTASRLEGLSKFYGLELIVSEQMLTGCPRGVWPLELDLVRVKGRLKPIKIYTLLDQELNPDLLSWREIFGRGVECFKRRDFKQARQIFEEVAAALPELRLVHIYLKRTEDFLKTPPPDDWDQVYTHLSK